MSDETKAVVTVSEMARMVGLSRARFYQLQKSGIFPPPERDTETGRPIYTEELQKVCLEVRRRNCGVNKKAILFYARRVQVTPPTMKPRKDKVPTPKAVQYAHLIEDVKSLGLKTVTAAQVTAALKERFPHGTPGMAATEVAKEIFLHLTRKN